MKSYKSFLFLTLAAALALSACSGLPKGPGGGGGGTGSSTVSFTMVADTPPANLGLVSLKVVPTAIMLTPTTGTATTLDINSGNGYSFDLVRLQSDSAFLGTATKVPNGTYTTVTVTFSSATLAFYNGTGAALTNPVCPSGDVCFATFAGPFTATITTSQDITANAGFGIDIDLTNALTISGTTLSLNFGNTDVASVFTLPRTNSNLTSGQLDLIEDYTGVVTVSATTATVTPATIANRPALTATVNSSTVLNEDPTLSLCTSPAQGSISSCVSSNQAVSMDAILNSDGTFTAQEIEPLLASPIVDTVEGTIVAITSTITPTNQTQFTMVTTDIIPAATNSLIGSLTIGAPLVVNLSAGPTFYVDSKGLPVANSFPTSYGFFTQSTNTAGLHVGQEVAVHVTAFTAAVGTTFASSTTNIVALRWSRFIATPSGASTNSLFNVTALPGYFGFTSSSILESEIFTGVQGTNGTTNLDGIPNGSAPGSDPVGVRALFIEDAGNTLTPSFFAAKVRQH
jgi:hypothetical protein